MTHGYVDAEVQTDIAGLVDDTSAIPPALCASCSRNDDTNRESELDMSTDILPHAQGLRPNAPSNLLLRRGQAGSLLGTLPLRTYASNSNSNTKNALPLSNAHRSSQPDSNAPDANDANDADDADDEATDEITHSPPPTQAVLSPLPPANLLHAGHTPILPRSFSPVHEEGDKHPPHEPVEANEQDHAIPSGDRTPDLDEALKGPLSLPLLPSDGCADRIELRVLDAELEKIARARSGANTPGEEGDGDEESVASSPTLGGRSPDWGTSPGEETQKTQEIKEEKGEKEAKNGKDVPSRKTSVTADEADVVDGVILKKPPMNMGAPLGQV